MPLAQRMKVPVKDTPNKPGTAVKKPGAAIKKKPVKKEEASRGGDGGAKCKTAGALHVDSLPAKSGALRGPPDAFGGESFGARSYCIRFHVRAAGGQRGRHSPGQAQEAEYSQEGMQPLAA